MNVWFEFSMPRARLIQYRRHLVLGGGAVFALLSAGCSSSGSFVPVERPVDESAAHKQDLVAMQQASAEQRSRPEASPHSSAFELNVAEWPRIMLKNNSGTSWNVLLDSLRQPVVLRLYESDSRELPAHDKRAVMKFTRDVLRARYQEVMPGSSVLLEEAKVSSGEGETRIEFGPFIWEGLSPGKYRCRAEWQSQRDDYVDETGQANVLGVVWRGSLMSETFEIVVP